MASWISAYTRWRMSCDKSARFLPTTNGSVMRALTIMSRFAGFGSLSVTSHSMRRGGATQLLIQTTPMSDILLFGRWASEKSARGVHSQR